MYLIFLVKVSTVKGKITRRKKSNVVYIEYEYDRVYDPSRKYTFPKKSNDRKTIRYGSGTHETESKFPEIFPPMQNFRKQKQDFQKQLSAGRSILCTA